MTPVLLAMGLIVAAASGRVAAPASLLPDGGFEGNAWTLTTWDHGEARHEFTSEARTGTRAVKLTGVKQGPAPINVLALSPAIDVAAGGEYVLSLWYRTEGHPAASVSVLTFREPFAAAQWKTPTTAYLTEALPDSPRWRPFSWRFRTAPGSVQLIAAVRCGGVGSVWYDDTALLAAPETALRVLEPGTLVAHPLTRRLSVEVASGRARWRLGLLDANSLRLLASRVGQGPRSLAVLSYPARESQPLLLVLEDQQSGAVLAVEPLVVPPLIHFQVTSPRYRRTLYLWERPKSIRARLRCSAAPPLRRKMSYSVGLQGHAMGRWQPMPYDKELTLGLPARVSGKALRVVVRVKGPTGAHEVAESVRVVSSRPAGRHVVIGDRGETLVDGKPFFPAGFYGMPDAEQADAIPRARYTAALTYMTDVGACLRWLDRCRRLGLLGVVSVPFAFVARFDEARLRAAIRAVEAHPALLAYYLYDEPSPSTPGATPADLKRVYDVVADEDPHHPIAVCLCVPGYADDYADCFDVVLPDPYPLVKSVRPLTLVSDWVDEIRGALRGAKPIWIVPQAFGWDVIDGIGDPEQFRTPTPDQERCMTYLALVRGVQGVMYYCYHVYTRYDAEKARAGEWAYVLGGYLADRQPKLWSALARLGPELKRLGPALLRPGARSGASGNVLWRWLPPRQGDGAWLLAVNPDPSRAVSAPLPVQATAARVIFGNGSAGPAARGVRVSLPPLGTLAARVDGRVGQPSHRSGRVTGYTGGFRTSAPPRP